MTDWQQQVVLISPFFYPEPISTGKANQHLAEAFAEAGHGVTAVCSHPLYPSWIPERSHAGIARIRILRGGAWMRYPAAMPLRRFFLELWFAAYAAGRLWKLRGSMDVAVCVLPPSLFALFLHWLLPRRVRRIAVIHDLQGVLAAQRESLPRRVIIRLIHAVESRVFRSQDLCIFFSEDMARVAGDAYGLQGSRIAVQYPSITLPVDDAALAKAKAARNLEKILPSDQLHVVYSGALGYKQNSHELLAFMQAAAEQYPQVSFHVFSGGPFFDQLRGQYEACSGSRVQFHPLVAEQDLAELYARSAVQLVPVAEGTESGALPSKLPNLLAMGVYLLGICDPESEVGRLMRQAGTGSVVDRWQLDLFLAGLGSALATVQQESASVRRARVQPLLELFSIANMVRLAAGQESIQESVADAEDSAARITEEVTAMSSGARG